MRVFYRFFCFAISFLLLGSGLKAQVDAAPVNGSAVKKPIIQNKRLMPIEFAYNLADSMTAYDPNLAVNGTAGVIYFNNEFWVSKWAGNEILILDSTGSIDTLITITGLTGTRSFTTDGTSIFAGAAGNSIYAINPVTRTLDSTIVLPASSVGARMTAYDPTANSGAGGFWIANFTSAIELYSRSGVLLRTIPQATHQQSGIYGGAVDTVTPGGPYLAVYSQGVADQSRIDLIDIVTGTPAGIVYNTHMDLNYTQSTNPDPAIAGGLFISDTYNPNHQVIMGIMQGVPDVLFGYESSFIDCGQSSGLTATPINATDIQLTWNPGAGLSWNIEYGFAGFTLGTGTKIQTSLNTHTFTGLMMNQEYDFYVEDSCATGLSIWSGPATAKLGYCDPIYTSGCTSNDDINSVTLNGVNGTSINDLNTGCAPNSYDDKTSLPAVDVVAGMTHHGTINSTYTSLSEYAKIWIDFGDDGQFQDSTDLVGTVGPFSNVTVPFTIHIPSSADSGLHRMRIRDVWANSTFSFDACSSESWGEAHDYMVNVIIPGCPIPDSLTASNITMSSADLNWVENGISTEWEIEYGLAGFNKGNGNDTILSAKPYTLSGLTASTKYEFYVRAICGRNDSSYWAGPFSFHTAIGVPYFQDFESFGRLSSGINNIEGWSNVQTSIPKWETGSTTPSVNTGPEADHTIGQGGTFAFLETSGGSQGNADTLKSTRILINSSQTSLLFEFWYHMHGSTMGDLEVYIDTNGTSNLITTISGQQQTNQNDPWLPFSTVLTGYEGSSAQLIFVGVRATDYYGDLAIDDVRLVETPSCMWPTNLQAINITDSSATLSWTENNLATQWLVEYGPAGFLQGNGTIDTAAAMPTIDISGLTDNTLYEYYVKSVCGRNDSSIWAGPFKFLTPCLAVSTFPYVENFDGPVVSNVWNCWTVYNLDGGDTWRQANNYITARSTPYVAHGMGNNNDMLISPQFMLPATPMWLKWYDIVESATQNNIYSVLVSTTGNDTTDFTDTLITIDAISTTWKERTVDLSAYANQNIYIALHQTYSASTVWGFGVDDFTIEQRPSCMLPTNLGLAGLTDSSAALSWTENNQAAQWLVEYGLKSFIPGSGTIDTASTNPHSINGLSAATTYEFYVRSICGANDSSTWAGPFEFITPCVTISSFPYLQEFTTYVPTCWDEADDGTLLTGPSNFGSSSWFASDFLNAAANGKGVKVNLYSTFRDEWIISEPFDLSGGGAQPYELRLKAGVTDWLSVATANMGSDDEVHILISTNGGNSWTSLYNWNVNNQPSNTGTQVTVSLAGYNGTNNLFAIYATDGTVDDVEDYDFHIDDFEIRITPLPCAGVPDSVSISGSSLVCAGVQFTLDAGGASYGPGISYDWQYYDSTASAWVSVDTTSKLNVSSGIFSARAYRFITYCSNSGMADTSAVFPVGLKPANQCYCTPIYTSGCTGNDDINSVIVNGVGGTSINDLNTGCSPGSYDDKTNLPAVLLAPGTVHQASINSNYTTLWEYVKVWIDFNDDGFFDNTTELVGQVGPFANTFVPFTITVPSNANPGLHRMRMRNVYNGSGFTFDACASQSFGEAHDYMVNIVDVTAMPELTAPVENIMTCYTSSENVIVGLTNIGLDSLDFSVDSAFVHVNVSGAATAVYLDTITDNSLFGTKLPSNSKIDVSVGSVDMSTTGNYYFETFINLGSDTAAAFQLVQRDTITVLAPFGGEIVGLDTICSGDTVKLKVENAIGSIQWQSAVAGIFTDIAGADSTELTVSPRMLTQYRVAACGTEYSDTLTVEPLLLNQPVAFDSMLVVTCGDTGVVALVATSTNANATFEWFDVPTGGNPLTAGGNIVSISANGDTLYYRGISIDTNSPAIDTFYVQEVVGSSNGGNDSLTAVPFTGGNGCGAGNMFDIVSVSDMDITGFSINSNTTGSQNVDVYVKQGSYISGLNTASVWTLVETVTVFGNGSGNPSYVNLSNLIPVTAGDTFGIYINFDAAYTNIPLGTVYSNQDLSIIIGHGVCTAFSGGNAGRGFNGQIFYSKGYGCSSTRDTAIVTIDCIVGMEEATFSFANISIQPNPSRGAFHIIGNNVKEEVEISIYNANGKLVYQSGTKFINTFDERIDLSDLAKGMYFVKMQTKSSMEMKKIVLQ